jgi:hypothetical protein
MKPIKLIIRVVKQGKFRGMIDIFYAEIKTNPMFTCFDKHGHSDASHDYYYNDTRAARGEEIGQGEQLIKKVFGRDKYIIAKKIMSPKRLSPVQF